MERPHYGCQTSASQPHCLSLKSSICSPITPPCICRRYALTCLCVKIIKKFDITCTTPPTEPSPSCLVLSPATSFLYILWIVRVGDSPAPFPRPAVVLARLPAAKHVLIPRLAFEVALVTQETRTGERRREVVVCDRVPVPIVISAPRYERE